MQQWLAMLGNPLSPTEVMQLCRAFASRLEEGTQDGQWLVFSYATAPPSVTGLTGKLSLTDKPSPTHGTWSLPCVPTLIDCYVALFKRSFALLGQPLSDRDRIRFGRGMAAELAKGYLASPYSRLVVRYEPAPTPHKGFACQVRAEIETLTQRCDRFAANSNEALFGRYPDAKVMTVAQTLEGDRTAAPILDIGAGTGRNTLPLARLGHPIDAIELSGEFAAKLQGEADGEGLKVRATVGDILNPELELFPGRYPLVVLSEVIPHFDSSQQLRSLMVKLSKAMSPGGWLLLNLFLTVPEYEPDLLVRQMARAADSFMFTRSQFAEAIADLPLEKISEESVVEYERTHLEPEAWPPTDWFVPWAKCQRLFPLTQGIAPVELRWVLLRRSV